MKKQSIVVIAALGLMLSGCSGGDSNITAEETPPVSVRYVNGDPTNAAVAGVAGVSLRAEEEESAIPMLFYGVMVRAYQFGARAVMVGDKQTETWSSWNMIPFEEFYLPNGGIADLHTNYTEFGGAKGQEYVDSVGTFSFDFMAARGEPGPVNLNNSVCGAFTGAFDGDGDFSTLEANYPSLNFGTCRHNRVVSSVDGKDVRLLRAIFARNDWFPDPVQVYLAGDPNAVEGLQCYETNIPLSAFQEEVLTSLLNLEMDGAYTQPLFYSQTCTTELVPNGAGMSQRSDVDIPVTIIPQSGAPTVARLTQDAVPQPPIVTEDGQEIPQPDHIITSSTLRAEVAFLVTPSMVVNYDQFNVDEDTSDIVIAPGANGAPWGMELRFVDEQSAP